ncbi:GNAT family N-acetyltransferase [Actinocatenispora rupis]|uniref:N-acetyltransferase domain-containing protein n=1 Tax=Actinocatenispora rupis TaxID=519421 RepID=A0A8J3NE02_9ACTN|nr:GNAT family N-acetyltransferase [Actinocatenispora rupis]GID15829.1 hypothetical protein Aru02nite_67180 [Actinocatenispora rupis]
MDLRDVALGDLDAYVRMRSDPVMMAELGGPVPPDRLPDKVRRDVADNAADLSWIRMIVPDPDRPDEVAGTVALWAHESDGEVISEIGWMVLPEYQGRGMGKRAVRMLLTLAAADGRWGLVHATPAVTNGPSNGICRSVGFRLLGERDLVYAGVPMRVNDWVIDPATDLTDPA